MERSFLALPMHNPAHSQLQKQVKQDQKQNMNISGEFKKYQKDDWIQT